MGCKPSSLTNNSEIPNMEQMYSNARLPHAEMGHYKNPFEKEFFQVVNLLRNNPAQFVRYVKQFSASPSCKTQ